MGLLDSVIGALSGASGQPAAGGGGQSALIAAVLGMLVNGNGAGGGGGSLAGGGGLGDLLSKFQQAGLGDAAASWVGTGQNQPISPDQLESALGSDLIGNLARQIGLPHGETAGQLSELLPQVVDRLTPEGRIPDGGVSAEAIPGFEGLGDLLGRFSKG